jgi:cytochrome c553
VAAVRTRYMPGAATLVLLGAILISGRGNAEMWDDSDGGDPWDRCAECHGLDGAGNHIKFPRLAGQKPDYIVKQLYDFRNGRRTNDGGQMQKTATEVKENDYARVAQWFAKQTPPWPKLTLDFEPDLARARRLSLTGADGMDACLSCHSAAALGLLDRAIVAPRIAGQRDFYIAKQLVEYRAGQRSKNDTDQTMTRIARRLSDADIKSLAIFLSQNPALHDEVVP